MSIGGPLGQFPLGPLLSPVRVKMTILIHISDLTFQCDFWKLQEERKAVRASPSIYQYCIALKNAPEIVAEMGE